MIRPPSRADLGGELIAPLACVDARLSPSGGSLRVTVWPPQGEAVRVVMPVRGLLAPESP